MFPQLPQFAKFVCSSTHVAPQSDRPAAHPAVHAPPMHVVPGRHRLSQPPQFAGSLCVSVHPARQAV
jgi:hypothetical protein